MSATSKNHPASVLARLLNHSRTNRVEYQSLLTRYVGERFLYRLGKSQYRDRYVLKGAYLLSTTLRNQTYRTTKDVDFLKTGNTEAQHILDSLREICAIDCPEDAVEFDPKSISMEEIRERNAYQGRRARVQSRIGSARVLLQIDIGIGDSVYPQPVDTTIPTLLEIEAPSIQSYPIESMVAEKLEAIVALGLLTSRMKDFYDLYIISHTFTLGFEDLSRAVRQTFARRNTPVPERTPTALTEKIYTDLEKQTQWSTFVRKLRNEYSNLELPEVISRIALFADALWSCGPGDLSAWTPTTGWK